MQRRRKDQNNLGRSLIRSKANKKKNKKGDVYTKEWDIPKTKKSLESVLELSDLDKIAYEAELSQKKFTAERNVKIFNKASLILPDKPPDEIIEEQRKNWNNLIIPRRYVCLFKPFYLLFVLIFNCRPYWTTDMTADDLDKLEKEEFLRWRRKLAELESNKKLVLTPFEKNIEVWRQLWRVIERSDIVIQILDSRDPLLFRSLDLENYVSEFPEDKINVLLMNKADFLSEKQREMWAQYFKEQSIRVIFFSAKLEQLDIDKLHESQQEQQEKNKNVKEEKDDEDIPEDNTSETSVNNSNENVDSNEESQEKKITYEVGDEYYFTKVLNRFELLDYFKNLCKTKLGNKEKYTIGMVGYPNVGKSSTINVLLQKKKVAVSSTPGKTKHFQTLEIDKTITLCDCPGLVFPSFVSTKAEMLCCGLMRIAEMREYIGPISLVTNRIPREVLETVYGVDLSPKSIPINEFLETTPSARGQPIKTPYPIYFLQAFAKVRGFRTSNGRLDEFKAAKIVLNDYLDGKILFCRAPPTIDQKEFNKYTIQSKYLEKKNKT